MGSQFFNYNAVKQKHPLQEKAYLFQALSRLKNTVCLFILLLSTEIYREVRY